MSVVAITLKLISERNLSTEMRHTDQIAPLLHMTRAFLAMA